MTKKYKINADGRVVALRDFGDVKAGDVGGFVKSETNLSHKGNCWVFGDARVYGNTRVCGDAQICKSAKVFENAWVYGDAKVFENAWVYGDAQVCGDAWVFGNARVYGNTRVYVNAKVFGNARVYGNAQVYGNAWIYGNSQVFGDAWVYGNAQVYGNSQVCGITRSDTFCFCYVSCEDKMHRVIAGCRYFTMPEAREHWGTEHPKHKETYAILDSLESLSKVRPEGCV